MVSGKVQQHDEGQLVREKIIGDVRRRIVAAEDLVERKHRAQIEVGLLAELAVDLVHVAVELLEQALEAAEHGVERGLVAGKIGADEILERGGIPVFRPPEFAHLVESALNVQSLRSPYFAVTDENVWELPPLILHPFNERIPPSVLLDNSKAALMLSGLIPSDGTDPDELSRRLLIGRYGEIRMLFFLGKDVFRWLDQCMDWVTHA